MVTGTKIWEQILISPQKVLHISYHGPAQLDICWVVKSVITITTLEGCTNMNGLYLCYLWTDPIKLFPCVSSLCAH